MEAGELANWANEATFSGVFLGDQSIDLSFGNATDPRTACGNGTSASGAAAAPNCFYLIDAESRFGDGDHIFTVAEQTPYYSVSRGKQSLTAPGRRVRLSGTPLQEGSETASSPSRTAEISWGPSS